MSQLLQLHGRLVTDPPPASILDPNLAAVKLISACSARAKPHKAALVFSALPTPNLFAWNALLQVLALHRLFSHVRHYFSLLLRSSTLIPDEFTFTSVIKACAGLVAVSDGEQSHALITKRGFESNLIVRNSLVDMYFKIGLPSLACLLFDEMPDRDIVSWNTLVAGYCICGDVCSVRGVFDQMEEKKFCIVVARELFDRMPERNMVCWNAMIAGYSQNEKFSKAIELFRQML